MNLALDFPHQNFATLLWRAAERWPDRHLIIEDGQRTTFAEIRDSAAAFADAYRKLGVRPGDPVCILVRRGGWAASAFFGALAIGAIASFINTIYRPRQIRYVLDHSGTKLLVATDEFWDSLRDDAPPGITRIDPAKLEGDRDFRLITRLGDDAAQITYTSGSTGQPKGVVASHANLWAGAEIVPAYLGLTSEDRIASLLPFSFVYGFSQLICALVTGATLVVERSTLAQDILDGLRREEVTVLAGVPPTWMQLLHGGMVDAPLKSLRVATCAGGRLAPKLVRTLRQCQPQTELFLMYGLTEVFRSTFLPSGEVDAHPDSMGRAVAGSEVLVLREDGTPCDVGETGELVHRGPTVALGYWRDTEATARVFRPYPLRVPGTPACARAVFSGDLVKRDESGLLYYVGRRDWMIKTLGYRVSPEEISDTLLASGMVREAAVSSEPDPHRGERAVAHVCLKGDASLLGLKQFCGRELPGYMQPARYRVYESLPRNPAGKVDLLALRGGPVLG